MPCVRNARLKNALERPAQRRSQSHKPGPGIAKAPS
jgi:hypothetical protein